jgi:hypothetical protein
MASRPRPPTTHRQVRRQRGRPHLQDAGPRARPAGSGRSTAAAKPGASQRTTPPRRDGGMPLRLPPSRIVDAYGKYPMLRRYPRPSEVLSTLCLPWHTQLLFQHRGSLMRKAFLCLIAFCAFAFAAAPALAGVVKLTGTHSREEIKRTCDANKGAFDGSSRAKYNYACVGSKGAVYCKKSGQCVGSCEQCGKKASGFTFAGILTNAPSDASQPSTSSVPAWLTTSSLPAWLTAPTLPDWLTTPSLPGWLKPAPTDPQPRQ